MVVPSGSVQLGYSDARINAMLKTPVESKGDTNLTRRFTQNEEFFVELPEPVIVGSFPVHHDIGQKEPDPLLTDVVHSFVTRIQAIVPGLFQNLIHLFDPSSNHRPAFFRLYEIQGIRFLYVLRTDLSFRPTHATRRDRTTNRMTVEYETNHLFLESDLFPLSRVETTGDRISSMQVEQVIRDTWIGETGRGYMRAGMWLDRDITKFFSRLFTPEPLQTYPYYPFTCKYRTIAHATLALSESERQRAVQIARKGREFLLPHIQTIEESLRSVAKNEFSESISTFRELRAAARGLLDPVWAEFAINSYLNATDEREFEVTRGLV